MKMPTFLVRPSPHDGVARIAVVRSRSSRASVLIDAVVLALLLGES